MLTRSKIAAGGTVAALGVLAAVAMASSGTPDTATTAAPKPAPVEVRTEVVRRTVHVVKHEKRRRPQPAPTAETIRAAAPASTAAASSAPAAPAGAPAQSAPASPSPEPVRTQTSGGTGGQNVESERGDDGSEHGEYESEGQDD